MRVAIYPVLGPLFALLLLQLALKIVGEPGLTHQGFLPMAVILFYGVGFVPAVAVGKTLDFMNLHLLRPNVAAVLGLLVVGAIVAFFARHLELYMITLPPVVLCWLVVCYFSAPARV